jgi:hypothetical protein
VLARVVQAAAVQAPQRQQLARERGDDADVALATAQRPEQLGLVGGVRVAQRPFGGDHLEAAHPLGGVPERPAEHRQAAANGVADHADVGGRPVERGEPVRGPPPSGRDAISRPRRPSRSRGA